LDHSHVVRTRHIGDGTGCSLWNFFAWTRWREKVGVDGEHFDHSRRDSRAKAAIFISRSSATCRCVFRDASVIRNKALRKATLHITSTTSRDIDNGQLAYFTALTGAAQRLILRGWPSTIRRCHIDIHRAAPLSRRHGAGLMHPPEAEGRPRCKPARFRHGDGISAKVPSVNPPQGQWKLSKT